MVFVSCEGIIYVSTAIFARACMPAFHISERISQKRSQIRFFVYKIQHKDNNITYSQLHTMSPHHLHKFVQINNDDMLLTPLTVSLLVFGYFPVSRAHTRKPQFNITYINNKQKHSAKMRQLVTGL